MDEKRKGTIAYALLKRHTKKDGFHFDRSQVRREFGNASQGLEISVEELMEFADCIVGELYEEYCQKGSR